MEPLPRSLVLPRAEKWCGRRLLGVAAGRIGHQARQGGERSFAAPENYKGTLAHECIHNAEVRVMPRRLLFEHCGLDFRP